jgi:hypothetical protein
MGVRKQRSPAAPRWAGNQLHQIEKMHHRESSILKGIAIAVKLTGQIFPQRHCHLETPEPKANTSRSPKNEKPGLTLNASVSPGVSC